MAPALLSSGLRSDEGLSVEVDTGPRGPTGESVRRMDRTEGPLGVRKDVHIELPHVEAGMGRGRDPRL